MASRLRNPLTISLIALAIGTLLAGAGMARASSTKCNPGCEARADFRSRGEILTVHDYAKNGHSAVGWLEVRHNGEWLGFNDTVYWNSKGFRNSARVFNLTIPDGTPIRFKACQGDRDVGQEGTFFDCSRYWRYDGA
jgi:hypothetical protein